MEKQERRRKIISRGNDRMALITGRIQTLDPDPFAKSSSFSTPRRENPPALHARSSSEPTAANEEALFQEDHCHGGNDAPETATRHDNDEEVSRGNDSAHKVSHLKKLEQKGVARLTSENANLRERSWGYLPSSTTLKEINFNIISSEDTRAICSVVLAILVVLSHIHLSHDVVRPKSLIAHKPLYVVLLTDVFIVAAKMAPYKQQIRKEDNQPNVEEDGQNLDGAVKLLELGLVLYEAICAFFIDCSCYLVIVVCGLSLL